MKKTIRQYLEESRDRAYQDKFRASANYAMTRPAEGREQEFEEATRDCQIVEELIQLATEFPTTDDVLIEKEDDPADGQESKGPTITQHFVRSDGVTYGKIRFLETRLVPYEGICVGIRRVAPREIEVLDMHNEPIIRLYLPMNPD